MSIYKAILVVGIMICSAASWSAESEAKSQRGEWLLNGVNAYNRVYVTKNGNDEDVDKTLALLSYVSGVIAVHRVNNFQAGLYVGSRSKTLKRNGLDPLEDDAIRVALSLVPLLNLPEDLSDQQTVLILQRYLEQHPDQWTLPAAAIVTDALKAAFKRTK